MQKLGSNKVHYGELENKECLTLRNGKETGVGWNAKGQGTSGVAQAKVGNPLRDRCLDGNYGSQRYSEPICIITLGEAIG